MQAVSWATICSLRINELMKQLRHYLPMEELRLLVRSMMERLLGLLSNDRLASDMSAVTRVIATLTTRVQTHLTYLIYCWH